MSAEWAGLIGIALAALLASVGYIYQVRVEHKKSVRRVLYFLLEIRFNVLAAVFDPKEATDKYAEHFLSRCSAEGFDTRGMEFPEGMRRMITSHFEQAITAAKSDLEERLLGQFEEALLQLASVHPVLSYRLLGRNRLEKLVGLTKAYGTEVINGAIGDVQEQWAKDLLFGVSSEAQRKAFCEMASILDKDVLDLAWSCGYFEYRRCKRAIRNTAPRIDREFFAEIDPMINEFLRMAVEAASRARSQTPAPTRTVVAS